LKFDINDQNYQELLEEIKGINYYLNCQIGGTVTNLKLNINTDYIGEIQLENVDQIETLSQKQTETTIKANVLANGNISDIS